MQETAKGAEKTALKVGKGGLITLIVLGVILGHYAKWDVDAVYYLGLGAWWTPLHNGWNNLAVNVNNWTQHRIGVLNEHIANTAWWVADRHGVRDLGIGLLATMLVIMAKQKPLIKRHHYGVFRLATTPVLAFLVAMPVWILGGYLLYKTHTQASGWSYHGSNPWILDLYQVTGKQHIEFTVLGVLGALFVKLTGVVKGPADEFQWLLAEQGWPNIIPGMKQRKAWLADPKVDVHPAPKRPWVTRLVFIVMAVSVPLAAYGAWLTLAGPAKGAA